MAISAQSIMTLVQEKVQDDEWASAPRILGLFNRAVMECADRFLLPGLFIMGRVVVANNGWDDPAGATPAPLPEDWHKGIHNVRNLETGSPVKIWNTPAEFDDRFPKVQFGHVTDVCLIGNGLMFADVPSPATAERLRFFYFRMPRQLAAATDYVDAIPDHLATKLLFNFACAELYGGIEDGAGGGKANQQYHAGEARQALAALSDWCNLRAPQTVRSDRVRA